MELMARSGASRPSATGAATRQALIDAAIETLRADGFAGASARSIATRASCGQALVFYHFGSVVDLLLAALDEVSDRRRARYQDAVAGVRTAGDLVAVATTIFREDMASGDAAVLVEMIAGAATDPALGVEVAARVAPWHQFAEEAITAGLAGSPLGALVPVADLSHAVVALYLGLELLGHLEGDHARADGVFDQLARLTPLIEAFGPSVPRP
jgi:AcrR family transcriptional regulator